MLRTTTIALLAAALSVANASGQSIDALLTASDGASGDFFGTTVALSDDGSTAIVGATNGGALDEGRAYVFNAGGGSWTEQAVLEASSADFQDNFGYSVAVSADGSTAIVGAKDDDVQGNLSQGAAYLFTRQGESWSEEARLTASDGSGFDQFGTEVALNDDGTTALIGAEGDDTGSARDQGSAYVFSRSGGSWSEVVRLTASDMEDGDRFGWSVALDGGGTTALIGAAKDHVGGTGGQGSAYVFVDDGGWVEQAKLTASDGAQFDNLGWSVALSSDGSTALVGAEDDEIEADPGQGSAYVFVRSGATWTEQAKLTATDGNEGDSFGLDVALDETGSAALIGAPGADAGLGSAYAFTRSGSGWSEEAKVTAMDQTQEDGFGFATSLAGDGTTGLVGNSNDDIGGNDSQGSAVVVGSLPGAGEPTEPLSITVNEQIGVSDEVSSEGPVIVRVNEMISVSDAVDPLLPMAVRPSEAIRVSDAVRVDVLTRRTGVAEPGDTSRVNMEGAGVDLTFLNLSSRADVTAIRHSLRPAVNPPDYTFAGPGYWTLSQQGAGSFTANICFSMSGIPSGYDPTSLKVLTRASDEAAWTEAQTALRSNAANTERICATGLTSFSDFAVAQLSSANAPPNFAVRDVITYPDAAVTISGDSDQAFTVQWNPATDPEGEPLTYVWQLAASDAFASPIMEEEAGTATVLETTYGDVATALADAGIEEGATVDLYQRIVADDGDKQTASAAQIITLERGTLTDTGATDRLPDSFVLYANYPNPFNPETTIRFAVPRQANVLLQVYDALGREVETLIDRSMPPGEHEVRWDADGLASGVYVYRMEADDFVEVGRMVFMK